MRKNLFILFDAIIYIIVNIAIFDIVKAFVCDAIDILIENINSVAINSATNNAIDYIIE